MNKLKERIGTALRKARRAQGLTIKETADRVGMNRTYLGAIEAGKFLPSWQTLCFLCHVLHLQLNISITKQ